MSRNAAGLMLFALGALLLGVTLSWGVIAGRINDHAMDRFEASDPETARFYWTVLARLGDATALNNLGVLAQRGYDRRPDKALAQSYFEAAAGKGHAVAGYNLARMGENRHDTDPQEVRRQFALLSRLADAGDPHAAAEIARRLYFANRAGMLPEQSGGLPEARLRYFRQAAASGDPVYLYLLGDALGDAAREGSGRAMLSEAVDVLLAAHRGGEPRAAAALAEIARQTRGADKAALPEDFRVMDQFGWWQAAAEEGLLSAKCSFAVNWMRPVSRQERLEPPAPEPGPVDEMTETALRYAEDCAGARRETYRAASPAFGRPALYGGRPTGGYPALVNSPAYAAKILGIVHAEGTLRPRDPETARRWFERPLKEGFPEIQALINAL